MSRSDQLLSQLQILKSDSTNMNKIN